MTDQPTEYSQAGGSSSATGAALFRKAIYVFGGIVVVIGVVIAVGFLLPSKFRIEESITINAPVDVVYGHVATAKEWPSWTAWNSENYPDIEYSHSGPASGEGAKLSWTDPSVGAGSIVFTAAEANKSIDYEMRSEIFAQPMIGEFLFEENGEEVMVRWSGQGDVGSSIFFRYMGLIFPGAIGKEFREGLSGLKTLSETTPEAQPDESDSGEE